MEINEFKQAPEETVEHKRHNSLDNEGNAVGQNETAVGGAKPPDGLAAHLNYVLAERDKRARALWAETPAGTEAVRHLIETCKLREATIRKYHMGLVTFRAQGAGQPIMNALCVPVSDKRGSEFAPCLAAERPAAKRRGQYVLLAIPGLTANAKGTQQWKRGPVLTMYMVHDHKRHFWKNAACRLVNSPERYMNQAANQRHLNHAVNRNFRARVP
jgi:hypothetical protein